MTFISLAKAVTPTPVWDRLRRVLKPQPASVSMPVSTYQGVSTRHSVRYLHEGKFASAFDRFWSLDPNYGGDVTRLRVYHVCALGRLAMAASGDFMMAGISYGVAARTLYEVLDFDDRTLWLVDPFMGVAGANKTAVLSKYNQSCEYVAAQYPESAPVRLHTGFIPSCLPIPGNPSLAFVHLNTGDIASESASLGRLWSALSVGGIIVIDIYAIDAGHEGEFAGAIAGLPNCVSLTLPTGQLALFKQ